MSRAHLLCPDPVRFIPRALIGLALLACIAGGLGAGAPAPAPAGRAPAASDKPAASRPALRPATRPAATRPAATRPAVKLGEQEDRRLIGLTRRAIDQIQRGRLAEAEVTLRQAIDLDPTYATNLYNMACVQARLGRQEPALDYLERAALAGFTNFAHVERDPDLDPLRGLPRYRRFLERREEFQLESAVRALKWLKGMFGDDGYLYDVDTKHKLIFAAHTDKATLDAVKRWLVDQSDSQLEQVFSRRPDQFISIVLPSPAHYRQIVPNPAVGGFYNPPRRILIAKRLGQTMTHEFTHGLHAADAEALGQEHPIWLVEGLASLYEAAQFKEGPGGKRTLVPAHDARLPAVQAAVRGNRHIPFARLLKMDQGQLLNNPTLAYGQAGSMLLYLHERQLLRKFYETFKAGFEQDPTGRSALEQVTGRPLEQLEADWRRWVVLRRPNPLTTGRDGPVLGVRFEDTPEGLRIADVLPTGPAARDGLKEGDLLVGVDGLDVRDQASIVPMLSQMEPGDVVTLRVRRDRRYVEVPVTLARRGEDVTRPRPAATRPAATLPASR